MFTSYRVTVGTSRGTIVATNDAERETVDSRGGVSVTRQRWFYIENVGSATAYIGDSNVSGSNLAVSSFSSGR